MDEGIKRKWYLHTMNTTAHKEWWNSALTTNEILIHVTTWMTLKTCEISPSQKAKHHMIPLRKGAYSIQIHRATKWIMVAKEWAKRGMGSQCFMDIGVQLRVMTKLWRWMVVMTAQHCECTQCHWTVHQKMIPMEKLMLHIFYHNKKLHTLKFGVQTGSVRKAVDSASKDIPCEPFAMDSGPLPPQWLGWWLGPRF